MQSGTKTAVYLGAGILVIIIGISTGLSFLEPNSSETNADTETPIDKSGFKMAPELVGIADYINTTPEELKIMMQDKVVLYDIWTYSCINCIRTLPHITAWDDKYSDDGLLIIGVHSPEFEFEKNLNNVQTAVEKNGIAYPVVLDNDKETWKAFENRYWPRKYIADHEGYIRYDHIGEGAYKETERVIQSLLAERSLALGMQNALAGGLVDVAEFEHSGSRTPELYFGYYFAQGRNQLGNDEGFRPGEIVEYALSESEVPHYFYLDGSWKNHKDGMELVSDSGVIRLTYHAKEVNIVAGNNAELEIILDGSIISDKHAGRHVNPGGIVQVDEHDLYNIISSESAATHTLEIRADGKGLDMFTFTFG